MKIRGSVAKRVRSLRRARNWTQSELGARLGLSQSRLSEIERGAGSFSAEQLLLLVRLFNVPLTEFDPGETADEYAGLQNALARLGASHLMVQEGVVPDPGLGLSRAVHEALVSGLPRLVTALAPVIVLHADRVSLLRIHSLLAESGFEGRLSWLVENTLLALRSELATPLPPTWSKRYRRAVVVLEAGLEAAVARRRGHVAADILDPDIRSTEPRRQTEVAASAVSRRWGIVTSLEPEDFARALGEARAEA